MKITKRGMAENTQRTIYFIMILDIDGSWKRVGPCYESRETAVSWLPFVRNFHLSKAKVAQCTVKWDKNKRLTKESEQILLGKFNCHLAYEKKVLSNG